MTAQHELVKLKRLTLAIFNPSFPDDPPIIMKTCWSHSEYFVTEVPSDKAIGFNESDPEPGKMISTLQYTGWRKIRIICVEEETIPVDPSWLKLERK